MSNNESKKNFNTDFWLKTPDAARALACSPDYLKSQRDCKGGFLVAGDDYLPGLSLTAPIKWNIQRVQDAFAYRGRKAQRNRNGQKALAELQASSK